MCVLDAWLAYVNPPPSVSLPFYLCLSFPSHSLSLYPSPHTLPLSLSFLLSKVQDNDTVFPGCERASREMVTMATAPVLLSRPTVAGARVRCVVLATLAKKNRMGVRNRHMSQFPVWSASVQFVSAQTNCINILYPAPFNTALHAVQGNYRIPAITSVKYTGHCRERGGWGSGVHWVSLCSSRLTLFDSGLV